MAAKDEVMPEEKKPSLDSIDLDALQVAAKAAARDVIRSHGWKGMIEDADLLGTDERYLVLADPAVVEGLVAEVKALRLDAARYRFLRRVDSDYAICTPGQAWEDMVEQHLDAQVDASIEAASAAVNA
jgi:hypothetical protein